MLSVLVLSKKILNHKNWYCQVTLTEKSEIAISQNIEISASLLWYQQGIFTQRTATRWIVSLFGSFSGNPRDWWENSSTSAFF